MSGRGARRFVFREKRLSEAEVQGGLDVFSSHCDDMYSYNEAVQV